MKSYKPTTNIANRTDDFAVFLAGSIELDTAIKWQKEVEDELEKLGIPVNVFNPRRDGMDPNMSQDYDNPEFYHQVCWELNGLHRSDCIFMFFDPDCKSPISLLELGLFASSKKMIVVCPRGFWRKGNVDIVCEKYDVPLFDNLSSGIAYLKDVIVSRVINE